MVSADLYDKDGKYKETLTLKEHIFAQPINEAVVSQYIKIYLANQRQGTVSKKGRSMVSGGGVKPWRQKGTGRARAGSIRSPIWVGGGRTFGPYPRDYKTDMPKKAKRTALKSCFSAKAKEKKLKVLEEIALEKPRTKMVVNLLENLGVGDAKCLLLDYGKNETLSKSCRNIKNLTYKSCLLVNPYDLVNCEYLLVTKEALKKVEEVFSG
jgi:large subunit ribosomal protein L4